MFEEKENRKPIYVATSPDQRNEVIRRKKRNALIVIVPGVAVSLIGYLLFTISHVYFNLFFAIFLDIPVAICLWGFFRVENELGRFIIYEEEIEMPWRLSKDRVHLIPFSEIDRVYLNVGGQVSYIVLEGTRIRRKVIAKELISDMKKLERVLRERTEVVIDQDAKV